MGHQKAALEILTQLFTPQFIVQTPMSRTVLVWYLRFDLCVASMGTFEPSLPRHWIETLLEQCQGQLYADPRNLEWIYERAEGQLRLMTRDMCSLLARRKTGEFTEDIFQTEHRKMTIRLREWRDTLHPALTNPARLVTTSDPGAQATQLKLFNSISGPIPIYDPPVSFTTALICEWHSVTVVHLCQVTGDSAAAASAILGDISRNSGAVCQIIEAAKYWPTRPKGLLTMLHPSLGLASLFLPRSLRIHKWLREQFAWVESCGYVFPYSICCSQTFQEPRNIEFHPSRALTDIRPCPPQLHFPSCHACSNGSALRRRECYPVVASERSKLQSGIAVRPGVCGRPQQERCPDANRPSSGYDGPFQRRGGSSIAGSNSGRLRGGIKKNRVVEPRWWIWTTGRVVDDPGHISRLLCMAHKAEMGPLDLRHIPSSPRARTPCSLPRHSDWSCASCMYV